MTDDLEEWREWAREELFKPDSDPCAGMILVLIDEVRRLRLSKSHRILALGKRQVGAARLPGIGRVRPVGAQQH